MITSGRIPFELLDGWAKQLADERVADEQLQKHIRETMRYRTLGFRPTFALADAPDGRRQMIGFEPFAFVGLRMQPPVGGWRTEQHTLIALPASRAKPGHDALPDQLDVLSVEVGQLPTEQPRSEQQLLTGVEIALMLSAKLWHIMTAEPPHGAASTSAPAKILVPLPECTLESISFPVVNMK